MKLILKYLKNYKLLFFFNVISVFGFILVELGIPTIVATMIDVGVTNKDVSFIYMMGGCIALVSLIGVGGTIALGYCCSKYQLQLLVILEMISLLKYNNLQLMNLIRLGHHQ